MVIPKIRIINISNSAHIEREMNMANTAEESAKERKTRHAISTW
jgi:acetolactate synthase small subunit